MGPITLKWFHFMLDRLFGRERISRCGTRCSLVLGLVSLLDGVASCLVWAAWRGCMARLCHVVWVCAGRSCHKATREDMHAAGLFEDCWKVGNDVLKWLNLQQCFFPCLLREASVLQTPRLQVLH